MQGLPGHAPKTDSAGLELQPEGCVSDEARWLTKATFHRRRERGVVNDQPLTARRLGSYECAHRWSASGHPQQRAHAVGTHRHDLTPSGG